MCLFILYFGYNYRINQKVVTARLPYANQTIQPRTQITSSMISTMNVPASFLVGSYYRSTEDIVGKYSNYNTIISKGSLFYKDMLKENGSMIGIVGNDFFDYDKNQEFKKQLLVDSSIIGLVELPDKMFVSKPKIILVIQKKVVDKKNCFMVKLPSFTDVKEFNSVLMDIEAWFEKNKI